MARADATQEKFNELRKPCWGQHLWATGFVIRTIGNKFEDFTFNSLDDFFVRAQENTRIGYLPGRFGAMTTILGRRLILNKLHMMIGYICHSD
jgi:hypothetical protein